MTRSRRSPARSLCAALALLQGLPVAAAVPPSRPPRVNRTVPRVQPVPSFPSFSSAPSDAEIARARVFEEPLVPTQATSAAENAAFAAAVTTFLRSEDGEDVTPLTGYLDAHPGSAWEAGVLAGLGGIYRRTGRYGAALDAWNRAWERGASASDPRARAVADGAFSRALELSILLGRYEEVELRLEAVKGRPFRGAAGERLDRAQEGAWLLRYEHHTALPSGPLALDRLLAARDPHYRRHPLIAGFHATHDGASIAQMRTLAGQVGLGLQVARRAPGARIPVPAVVHLKLNHFSALVAERDGRYLLQDALFGDEVWVAADAIDSEASGVLLVPAGPLPEGWQPVGDDEAASVRGKCGPPQGNPSANRPCDVVTDGDEDDCPGMAGYRFHMLLANLNIVDTPLRYQPPYGPPVQLRLSYNHRETFQPQVFSYSNFGDKWTFDWLSYVEDNPAAVGSVVYRYVPGGGRDAFTGYDPASRAWEPERDSRDVLRLRPAPAIGYELEHPDGSREVYGQPDGAATVPRKVFLTERIDGAGNRLTFTYDETLRLVAVTDASGQVSVLSYERLDDPYKITAVTDPFGRTARFDYEENGYLVRITDTIGIASEFRYLGPESGYISSGFVGSLTTPLGTTTFSFNHTKASRTLEAVDPMGGRERLEYQHHVAALPAADPASSVPAGFASANVAMNMHVSLYWDKRAMAVQPGALGSARVVHWLRDGTAGSYSSTKRAEKRPLESRVWYAYDGQADPLSQGAFGRKPSRTVRVLADGTTRSNDVEYNDRGYPTRISDPLGRTTLIDYDEDARDLLKVTQVDGQGARRVFSATYDDRGMPLTTKNGAGQVMSLSYDDYGRPEKIVAPEHDGLPEGQRTIGIEYLPDDAPVGAGRVKRITGLDGGAPLTYAYDVQGRPRTLERGGVTLTLEHDAFDRRTRTTHPDGTFEATVYDGLDPVAVRDRLGRWTRIGRDALRRVTTVQDPSGAVVTQEWCACGGLSRLVDAAGNVTEWERDLQGRPTRETRSDGSTRTFAYDPSTGALLETVESTGPGGTTRRAYDADGRLREVSYPGSTTATVTFAYDAVFGRLTSMTDGQGTTTYAYHPYADEPAPGAGRLAAVDGPLDGDTVSYTYDELGRVRTYGLPGSVVARAYDARGRVESDQGPLGLFRYGYDGDTARPARLEYPNGQVSTWSYYGESSDRRLRQIEHRDASGGLLSGFEYAHDASGSITSWIRRTGAAPARLLALEYDEVERLTAVTATNEGSAAAVSRWRYAYDRAGNRTTEQIDGTATRAAFGAANRLLALQPGGELRVAGNVSEPATVRVQGTPAAVAADRSFVGVLPAGAGAATLSVSATDASGNTATRHYQTSVSGSTASYAYDANGRVTSDGTRAFEWDAAGRLVRVSSGAAEIARFAYDGLGRRVQKTAGGVTRTYVYDGASIVEERVSTGEVVRYVHGPGVDMPLAQSAGGVARYFVADHLGSVVQATDAGGTPVLTREYDPFGRPLVGAGTGGPAFTGREWDPETGLYYYRARYYDPAVGRFLSPDPAGPAADGPNLYAYVRNNPVGLRDPQGLWSVSLSAYSFTGGGVKFVQGADGLITICIEFGLGAGGDFEIDPKEQPESSRDQTFLKLSLPGLEGEVTRNVEVNGKPCLPNSQFDFKVSPELGIEYDPSTRDVNVSVDVVKSEQKFGFRRCVTGTPEKPC